MSVTKKMIPDNILSMPRVPRGQSAPPVLERLLGSGPSSSLKKRKTQLFQNQSTGQRGRSLTSVADFLSRMACSTDPEEVGEYFFDH